MRDFIGVNEITDSLARAFAQIDDFQAVQHGSSEEELLDAVLLLQESVGIGDQTRAVIRERLESHSDVPNARGHVVLGLIVGLTAAALDAETA